MAKGFKYDGRAGKLLAADAAVDDFFHAAFFLAARFDLILRDGFAFGMTEGFEDDRGPRDLLAADAAVNDFFFAAVLNAVRIDHVFDDGVGPGMAEGAEHGFRAGEFLPADGAVGHVFTGTVVHAVRFDDVLRDGRPRLVRFRRHLGELHAAVGADVAGEAVLRTACLLEHDKIAEIILMRPFGVAAPDRVQFFRGIVAQLHEGVCVQRAEDAPDPVPAGGLISRSGIRDQSRRGYDGRAATHGGAEKLSEPGHAVAFRFLRFLRFPRLFALGDFPLKDVFLPHGHGGFLKKGHVGIFRREFRIDAVLRLGREIFIIIPLIVHTVSAFREEGCGVLKPLWQSPGRIVNTNLL